MNLIVIFINLFAFGCLFIAFIKDREKTKQVEFRIKAIMNDDGSGRVEIADAYRQVHNVDAPFDFWMMACEYLLHKTAQKSNKPYEDAISLLVKGALTYKDKKF